MKLILTLAAFSLQIYSRIRGNEKRRETWDRQESFHAFEIISIFVIIYGRGETAICSY